MTISQSIITWLLGYTDDIDQVYTEYLKPDAVSVGIYTQPRRNVRENILGERTITEYYLLRFRFDSSINVERVSNQAFLEELQRWVNEQNKDHHFPALSCGEVKEVTVSSPYYLETADGSETYIYQMSLSITYEERITNNG